MAKKGKRRCDTLPVLHPDAAGIDVGASELFVAVSADRDPHPVRSFPTFTCDLHALADWLEQCGIHSVAMESTSVYWIPIYQILEARGLEVYLVNAQSRKERSRSEDRRLGLPVAPVPAFGWAVITSSRNRSERRKRE
jgi:transposase